MLDVPQERKYSYTFENLAKTTEAFIDALNINKFAMYIFDYGAPVGLRSAPSWFVLIILLKLYSGSHLRAPRPLLR